MMIDVVGVANGRRRLRAVTAVTLLCVSLAATPAIAGEAAARDSAPAMRLYRDPQTGAIGAPPRAPAADPLTAPGQPATSARQRVAQELSEEAVDVPGGGVKINLRGQFRAAMTRGVTSSGPAGHACTEAGAHPGEPAAHE